MSEIIYNFALIDAWLQSLEVLCDLACMTAENKQREIEGKTLAWGTEEFNNLILRLEDLRCMIRR